VNKEQIVMWNREIRVPSVEEAKRFAPTSFDFSLARSKGLIEKDDLLTDRYLKAQAVYKAAFSQYLIKAANIDQYEKSLNESGYTFVPTKYENQSVYQRYCSLASKFFFIRNNFHIERLSIDDLKTLADLTDEEALVTLAERTYKDMIKFLPPDVSTENFVIYEFDALTVTKAHDDALLIILTHTWEFDDIGNLISIENERAKENFTGSLTIKMQEQLSKTLGTRTVVYARII